jgi:hypothetical protein
MCEHCPIDGGPCCVCGRADDQAADLAAMIRAAERDVIDADQRAADARHKLARLRQLAGRRPGDGSDQLRLFAPEPTPTIFDAFG